MASGFTGSILGTLMQGNGPMGRAMGSECKPAPMGAAILGSSSAGSSTASAATISETEIDMRENILETRFMDLASITLLMVTVTRGHGTKVVSKAMVCILSEMETQDAVNGGVPAALSILYHH
ncbi:hypothetical protein F2P56_035134 [Juglans regia]|uniref:Uncharacterized protein n=1 Tax=Juglans regia TaxID=51240 RepID=A0A833TIS5_JUGRE|nr:hypothetical protein F2P56_035134 [Juglans regia]